MVNKFIKLCAILIHVKLQMIFAIKGQLETTFCFCKGKGTYI